MEAAIESLTTSEAAIAAGVTVAKINRMIDKRILPKMLYKASQNRTVRKDACLWIAFYFETADWLTPNARLETISKARADCSNWEEWKDCIIGNRYLTIRFADLWKAVDERLHRLMEARRIVVEDPEILSGTPVIRTLAGVAAGTGIAVLATNVLTWLWGI